MSDIAIHQLPAAGTLTGAETLPIDDGAATRRTTVDAIRQGLAATGHGHAVAEVTGLQAALDAKAPAASPVFTGTVSVPAGSAAAPGLSFAAGTGVSSPAAGTVGISTGGSERVRIGSATAATTVTVSSDATGADIALLRANATSNTSSAAILLGNTQANVAGGFSLSGDGGLHLHAGVTASGSATVASRSLSISAGGAVNVLTGAFQMGGTPVVTAARHLCLRSYTVATLPSAAGLSLVYVSDGAANKRLAVSDGSVWRWPDGAVVS
ncbi:hypothetical protein HL658_35250 [Azospirillum sp. RWY-5-1]|uniref:Uncharacterized protein n=1 Tax=Azospirillum oleiclasticum TaxID=2735135 RepID=A0ABX2TMZ8_9PROT|nr:hypothetical protein [Azospirillum oleiclasticum]NYZ17829.1 hypothetical protein [Azospirillum oleiclasticum]NYZ25039.1 hypothetical protein [Azospirillum oleiclasticum]